MSRVVEQCQKEALKRKLGDVDSNTAARGPGVSSGASWHYPPMSALMCGSHLLLIS